jgi:hypothetical protein
MARSARETWIRLTATLLAVAALLPALHDALSHRALSPGEVSSVGAALPEAGTPAAETCPICLAKKQTSALCAPARAHSAVAPAMIARAPAPPLVSHGVVLGAASPRGPPIA